jgi:hypothetical protein
VDASRFIENTVGRKVSDRVTAKMHLAADERTGNTKRT